MSMQIIILVDMIAVIIIAFKLIEQLFGDGPLVGLLGIFGSLVCAGLYAMLIIWIGFSFESHFWGLVAICGPIFIVISVALFYYIFSDRKNIES